MKKSHKNVVLNNGTIMPNIGFGTDRTFIFIRKNIISGLLGVVTDITRDKAYHFKRDMSIRNIVRLAPKYGCTLFDTASAYGQSERVLGHMLKDYKREDLFIVTKLSNSEQRSGDVRKAFLKSLKRLNMDYVDLYLMHWPQPGTFIDSWLEMEKIYKDGLAKAIGVCNFNQHHLEELSSYASIIPMVNQFECHPLFNQKTLNEFCKIKGIKVMAYTPTGRMDIRLRENKVLNELSNKYKKSVAQIIIRWHYQQGRVPIINTTKLNHLKENMDVFDFELTEKEVNEIDNININCRLRYDPDNCDFTKL